jgi:hypothetical protein
MIHSTIIKQLKEEREKQAQETIHVKAIINNKMSRKK